MVWLSKTFFIFIKIQLQLLHLSAFLYLRNCKMNFFSRKYFNFEANGHFPLKENFRGDLNEAFSLVAIGVTSKIASILTNEVHFPVEIAVKTFLRICFIFC